MNIELSTEQIEAHFEMTRQLLLELRTKLPQTKDDVHKRPHTLVKLYLDEDGILTAEYGRYMGCGEHSTFTEYPKLSDLAD